MSATVRRISAAGQPDVFSIEEPLAGLRAFLAFGAHDDRVAFGGIRRKRYPSHDDARRDAERLAHQMERKLRAAETGCGGAKTVVLDHDGLDRRDAYAALGGAFATLERRYVCGPDVGTSDADLAAVRGSTPDVNHPGNDPGETTARGVALSCLATLRRSGVAIEGARVVVEGLGAVGGRVARALAAAGARLIVHDVDAAAVARVVADTGAAVLARGAAAVEAECDLFAPCALGGVVTAENVERIAARAVCGSANDQLADDALACKLHDRGVLWAPDFIVNAGAVIEGVLAHGRRREDVAADIDRSVAAIADRLERVFAAAGERRVPPLVCALELAGESA